MSKKSTCQNCDIKSHNFNLKVKKVIIMAKIFSMSNFKPLSHNCNFFCHNYDLGLVSNNFD